MSRADEWVPCAGRPHYEKQMLRDVGDTTTGLIVFGDKYTDVRGGRHAWTGGTHARPVHPAAVPLAVVGALAVVGIVLALSIGSGSDPLGSQPAGALPAPGAASTVPDGPYPDSDPDSEPDTTRVGDSRAQRAGTRQDAPQPPEQPVPVGTPTPGYTGPATGHTTRSGRSAGPAASSSSNPGHGGSVDGQSSSPPPCNLPLPELPLPPVDVPPVVDDSKPAEPPTDGPEGSADPDGPADPGDASTGTTDPPDAPSGDATPSEGTDP